MTKLLLKLFLKNKDETTVSREAYGAFAGAVGMVCNILLALFKIAAGWLSGSISIVADGVNNLSDAASSVVTLAGFRMSQKPADREHPYGHARMEYMAGMFIAVAIILVGFELLRSSVEKILTPAAVAFAPITFVILGISVVVKWWMRTFYKGLGKKIGSTTLSVAADDSRNDVITTLVVLVGAAVQHFTGLMLDGWLGCAVAVFILVSGVLSVKETMSPLLGEAPSDALVSDIYGHITGQAEVLGVHDLLVHAYGPGRQFATVHVEMDAAADPLVSHGIIDNIERAVERDTGVRLVIHLDPITPHDPETEALARQIDAMLKDIDADLSAHDLRIARTHDHTNIIFDVGAPSRYTGDTAALQARIGEAVRQLGDGYYPVVVIDRNYRPPAQGNR